MSDLVESLQAKNAALKEALATMESEAARWQAQSRVLASMCEGYEARLEQADTCRRLGWSLVVIVVAIGTYILNRGV